MHNITITHQCGCVKRSGVEIETNIVSKDDALMNALEMKNTMNEKFCGKHNFDITEDKENFLISFAAKASVSSSCCGGTSC